MNSIVVDFLKERLNENDFDYAVMVANTAKTISKSIPSVDMELLIVSSYLSNVCWIRYEKTVENIVNMGCLSSELAKEILESMKFSEKSVGAICDSISKSCCANNDTAEQQVLFESVLICRIGARGLYYWGSVLGFDKYLEMLPAFLDDAEMFIMSEKGKALAAERVAFSRNLLSSFRREIEEIGYI